jgi:hypothetical protein
MAYGFEAGIFTDTGRFRADANRDWQTDYASARKRAAATRQNRGLVIEDEWPELQAKAFSHGRLKPPTGDVLEEQEWLRGSLVMRPNFQKAPSRMVVARWLTLSKPGNEQFLLNYMEKDWERRSKSTPRPIEGVEPDVFDGRECSHEEALLWVATKLFVKVAAADAPSELAWSVYQWAKKNVDRFYSMFLPAMLRTSIVKQEETEEDFDPVAGVALGPEKVGRVYDPLDIPDAPRRDSDRTDGKRAVASEGKLARF